MTRRTARGSCRDRVAPVWNHPPQTFYALSCDSATFFLFRRILQITGIGRQHDGASAAIFHRSARNESLPAVQAISAAAPRFHYSPLFAAR
ncbi:hypothetical protein LGM90_05060 [Burkholderia sp. AU28942]|uniref:hypothetical protein n=1 Tax=Burkholderia TaxID=32008 RepID=UPI0008420D6D|nr:MULTISPECIES: hypothetical protein [Burkholderia]AOK04657.1 hypothetical protein WK25_09375 [Burkholderia latens]MCA8307882.1 hypothetical protein [Burkholderia sp. AU28942]QTO47226.1 hypothetical protein J8I86_09220 [Burkholderia latens]